MSTTSTIFFIGKPGCGKGTQTKLLGEHTGWPVFASGRLFRAIAQQDSMVGRKIKSEVDAGGLPPHWFAMHLYLESLLSISEDSSAIFDGFNRRVPEAELVIQSLLWLKRPYKVVYIDITDETVHERVAGRTQVERRVDDAVVTERLKEYYANTAESIELFRAAGALIEVNGEQTPVKIAADIRVALGL